MSKELDTRTANDIAALSDLASNVVKNYTANAPIYTKITEKLLEIFNNDDEIKQMEHKDLLKLLDTAQKAQLQPVIEITKMIKAITELEDINSYKKRTEQLEEIINTYKAESADHGKYKVIDIETATKEG